MAVYFIETRNVALNWHVNNDDQTVIPLLSFVSKELSYRTRSKMSILVHNQLVKYHYLRKDTAQF